MTIHFRSRIKSPINYSGFLFPGLNGCCCVGSADDGFLPFKATLNECNARGGYFTVTEDENCNESPCLPKGTTGCCCACSYGGMTQGIEKATCEDVDGIWKIGPCPPKKSETEFCTDPYGRNVKNKRACCGVTFEGGETYSYCENVCLARECVDNTIKGYSPKFYVNGEQCPQNCSGILDNKRISYGDQDTGKLDEDVVGNCCIQSSPCICLENLSLDVCNRLNGSFYVLGDTNYSCRDCANSCSNGLNETEYDWYTPDVTMMPANQGPELENPPEENNGPYTRDGDINENWPGWYDFPDRPDRRLPERFPDNQDRPGDNPDWFYPPGEFTTDEGTDPVMVPRKNPPEGPNIPTWRGRNGQELRWVEQDRRWWYRPGTEQEWWFVDPHKQPPVWRRFYPGLGSPKLVVPTPPHWRDVRTRNVVNPWWDRRLFDSIRDTGPRITPLLRPPLPPSFFDPINNPQNPWVPAWDNMPWIEPDLA